MSLEGDLIWLCSNGHLFSSNFHTRPNLDLWECPYCTEGAVWKEVYDCTNGKEPIIQLVIFEYNLGIPRYYIPWDDISKQAEYPANVPYKKCVKE